MGNPNTDRGGVAALQRLKTVDPPLYLSPSAELSQAARSASQYIFSSLHPFCPKAPFDSLLLEGFDAEQIWQQIDLQSKPLLSNLRREVKLFEKSPEEISKLFGSGDSGIKKNEVLEKESEGFEEEDGDFEEFDDEEVEGSDDDVEEEDDDDEEEEKEEAGGDGDEGIEDRFLKINELEEYLEENEAKEYGIPKKKPKQIQKQRPTEDENEEDEDDEIGFDIGSDEEEDELGNARYDDFFGGNNKKNSKRNSASLRRPNKLDTDDEQEDDDLEDDDQEDDEQEDDVQEGDVQGDDDVFADQKGKNLSTHEKETQKRRSEIEKYEKANMDPKIWTMGGEVTASKRPKNSALGVDLDFDHNAGPAPVITEEITASLEDIIKKRILEGRFDDVQRAPNLPSKAPRALKDIDENKSKEPLADIYEKDYEQKTGLASAPLSFSDEQKKEANNLFQQICLKLDALSHFHFTPKPVIEDMSIQVNVPALAMEEIAPVVVSDATMLAPQEVFAGDGDIKEEAELTQADRKRRRANKKRKFRAEKAKQMVKKPREDKSLNTSNGKEES